MNQAGSWIVNRIEFPIFAVIILLLSIGAYQRNVVWSDEQSLWLNTVLKSPENARAHNNLGRAYRKNGFIKEAVAEFKKAVELKNFSPAHSNLGSIYITWGWYEEAEREIRAALNSGPLFPDLYNSLGIINGKKGLWDRAIEEFERALEIDPNYTDPVDNMVWAYTEKGFALGQKKRYQDAIASFEKALSIDQIDSTAHYGLGLAYEGLGRKEEALKHWREFMRLVPEDSLWKQDAMRHIRRLEREITIR